jgi:hypothetical protein
LLCRLSEKYFSFHDYGLLRVAGRQGEYSGSGRSAKPNENFGSVGGRSARPNENFGSVGGRSAQQNENFGSPGGQQLQYWELQKTGSLYD